MRARIPARRRARPWNDVVPAPFEYGKLDVEGAAARIRLDSTCFNVRNVDNGVELASMREGKLNRVAAM